MLKPSRSSKLRIVRARNRPLIGNKKTAPKNNWELINSPIVIALITTILVGLVSTAYTIIQSNREQYRKDEIELDQLNTELRFRHMDIVRSMLPERIFVESRNISVQTLNTMSLCANRRESVRPTVNYNPPLTNVQRATILSIINGYPPYYPTNHTYANTNAAGLVLRVDQLENDKIGQSALLKTKADVDDRYLVSSAIGAFGMIGKAHTLCKMSEYLGAIEDYVRVREGSLVCKADLGWPGSALCGRALRSAADNK